MLLNNKWDQVLSEEFNKDYFLSLQKFLDDEYSNYNIYPLRDNLFSAFRYTDYLDVKVVILGQDPYHGPNQAHGLAFSVYEGQKIPPSLRNIYKEIEEDLGIKMSANGNLKSWAKQGVLLLNTVLTVRHNEAKSHQNKGWEIFTDQVIKSLNKLNSPIVFILWGNDAKKKIPLISNPIHQILTRDRKSVV